jgi:hypothetical protein
MRDGWPNLNSASPGSWNGMDEYTRKRGPSEFDEKSKQEGFKGGLIVSVLSRRHRLRIALLNAPLFLLFGAAWVSDKWPNLATSAMVIAFVIAGLEFAALAWLGKRAKLIEDRAIDEARRDVDHERAGYEQTLAYRERRYFRHHHLVLQLREHQLQQMRASRVETWAFGSIPSERWLEHLVQREVERAQLLKHSGSNELRKWKFESHGPEAFNIIAGAFVIEHFHGQTNIRVLDPSRVSVESKVRGDLKGVVAPIGIKAATYQ